MSGNVGTRHILRHVPSSLIEGQNDSTGLESFRLMLTQIQIQKPYCILCLRQKVLDVIKV